MAAAPLPRLEEVVEAIGQMAIAVSGGVDSMTLAHVAHRRLGSGAIMIHALSPAVPSDATARVRRHAKTAGWRLELVDAGEMADPRYLQNPVNRCFFCKTNLYARIAPIADGITIASGTNTDDLGDFRPGLTAARDHGVRHPFVEAGLAKSDVRAVAASLGLPDLSELPAAPCLSSRIETGIPVTPDRLAMIETVETIVRNRLGNGTIRCRLRADGVVIELSAPLMEAVETALTDEIQAVLRAHGLAQPARIEPYRMGSAFLHA